MLFAEGGDFVGWLQIGEWFDSASGALVPSWIVSWAPQTLDGRGSPLPTQARVAHATALPPDSSERERLVERAWVAIEAGPTAPTRIAMPDESLDARLQLALSVWDDEFTAFRVVAERGVDSSRYERFQALQRLFAATYAVDESLQSLWRGLPTEFRVDASQEADLRFRAAIAHNERMVEQHDIVWNHDTDPTLARYRSRVARRRPYEHWSDPLTAGVFHGDFFNGLAWIRGKHTHANAPEPMELMSNPPGRLPRWKWKNADDIAARGPRMDAGRLKYQEALAGSDVLGYFSQILDVFVEGEHMLQRLRHEAEAVPTE